MPEDPPSPPVPIAHPTTMPTQPSPLPSVPAVTGETVAWRQQPMSLQSALAMALATAVVSAFGTGGGLTAFSGGMQNEVVELRRDVEALADRIEDIYDIVDRAHPRFGRDERDDDDR